MNDAFSEIFGVPEAAEPFLSLMVPEPFRRLIASLGASFTEADAAGFLRVPQEEAGRVLEEGYHLSILDRDPERPDLFRAGSFYDRLGVFCQYEPEKWYSVPRVFRDQINRWYMDEYIRRNQPLFENGTRKDLALPLEETLAFIDRLDGPFTVRPCDCRNIFDNCRHMRETCIGIGPAGVNSSADRGQAREITKEEAKELVRACDKDGLMHTVDASGHAICNCCGDCCFEYRSALETGKIGPGPGSYITTLYIAEWDRTRCVNCGLCAKRCHLAAFTKLDGEVAFHPERCAGCGICSTACPKKAIVMKRRDEE
ncbi:4Fe-4S binding protein [Chordicoccus furentiruminis]|uniref:4Fe-4S binding protein n=1 Tax=Chordicoccus furentiruminis TaxID=2709410 RepID=UPI0023A8CAF6|nr:4Fe-4S binding protein [Chordicoccus furentiruminis]